MRWQAASESSYLPDAFLLLWLVLWESLSKCFEVFLMADLFPLSVILHFPPEVYLSRGVGDLCPLLVHALHANKISALQFLCGGRVRVQWSDV